MVFFTISVFVIIFVINLNFRFLKWFLIFSLYFKFVIFKNHFTWFKNLIFQTFLDHFKIFGLLSYFNLYIFSKKFCLHNLKSVPE